MRRIIICQAAALFTAVAAFAQQPSLDESQKQSFPAQQQEPAQHNPANITPPPPLSQPQAPIADQAAPAAVAPAQANTASGPAGPGPLGATGQTMPSTISNANAALDKKPILALQFPLADEQTQLIANSVAKSPNVQTKANLANTHVAMSLPMDVPVQPFSDDLTRQVAGADRYRYVKLNERVLIVDPIFLTVVRDIKL